MFNIDSLIVSLVILIVVGLIVSAVWKRVARDATEDDTIKEFEKEIGDNARYLVYFGEGRNPLEVRYRIGRDAAASLDERAAYLPDGWYYRLEKKGSVFTGPFSNEWEVAACLRDAMKASQSVNPPK